MSCRIVILGAGISGLSCAWFLNKKWKNKVSVTILEKDCRVGGWIETTEQENFLFEHGPRSFRPKGSGLNTLELIEDLGLADQVIAASPSSCHRYLYYQQQLKKVPSTPLQFISSPLMKGVIGAAIREFFTPKGSQKDESIYEFFRRRLSGQIADRLIDPLVSGIYAGDIRQLSLKSCFPTFYELEQTYGSLIKGMFKKEKKSSYSGSSSFIRQASQSPILSFKKGMQTLPRTLASQLEGSIRLNANVTGVQIEKEQIFIQINEQERIEADYVFSTLPLHSLTKLFSFAPDLAAECASIPYATIGVVNLGYHSSVLEKKGFGYLVPTQEKEDILGCVWDSSVFPEQNQIPSETRLTVMIGGMHHPSIHHLTENELLTISLRALNKHIGISQIPDQTVIKIARQAIPQYLVGYQESVEKIRKQLQKIAPRFYLLGNGLDGVALNDCIKNAKVHAQSFHSMK